MDATAHALKCRRNKKGPPMSVAYEHVRVAPTGELSAELLRRSLEDELYSGVDEDTGEREETPVAAEEGTDGDLATRCDEEEPPLAPVTVDRSRSQEDGEIEVSNGRRTDLKYRRSFFSAAIARGPIGEPEKDIGDVTTEGPKDGEMIASDEQHVLSQMYSVVGSEQVTRRRMECAPQWILDKSVKTELDSNWSEAYVAVQEDSVPINANIISSHFVYKVKNEENGKKRLKARLCPHGNRDRMKDSVRKDSATAQFDVIRIVCSMATVLRLKLGCLDIKGAYLQSGPIRREIYVRPPKECGVNRGTIWKLVKLPYGITEAGRQWAKVFEGWLLSDANFERVFGVSQIFVKRSSDGGIVMLMAKVTDDLLMAGSVEDIKEFVELIGKRFPISKAIIDNRIKFNGSEITQKADGTVILSMEEYLMEMQPIEISPERKKHRMEKATEAEIGAFRALAGEFVWIGSSSVPQAAYIGSWMQQRVPNLRVEELVQANGMLKEAREMKADIMFRPPADNTNKVVVTTFSDAAFNISQSATYGQTGIVCGIRFVAGGDDEQHDVYHLIDWASLRQRRVCYSSYGAEILACTEADDRGYNLKMGMMSLFPGQVFTHELNVDSKGLYDTVTTLHEGRDYRLRQTVQRIRDSFEAKELNLMRWVQGPVNIADALTKRSTHSQRMLNKIAHGGLLSLPKHRTFAVDGERWS